MARKLIGLVGAVVIVAAACTPPPPTLYDTINSWVVVDAGIEIEGPIVIPPAQSDFGFVDVTAQSMAAGYGNLPGNDGITLDVTCTSPPVDGVCDAEGTTGFNRFFPSVPTGGVLSITGNAGSLMGSYVGIYELAAPPTQGAIEVSGQDGLAD